MSYSWGDDTSVSSNSGGFSYRSARKAHSDPVKSYAGSKSTGGRTTSRSTRTYRNTSRNAPNGKKGIKTDSPYPLVIAVDVTGSMEEWPGIIFEKLPLLYGEVKRYMPETEISFAAVGDANTDSYPLQICDFGKGKKLDDMINSLYAEGNGGGQSFETYELAGHFYLNHCDIPKAKKPIMIFTGDEGFYKTVDPDLVKEYIGDDLKEPQDAMETMKKLAGKFDTYILRKNYGMGEETRINNQWKKALGNEKVMKLDDPRRIVDCIIGIVAGAAGQFLDYSNRLSNRQTQAQVKQVMTSLKTLGKKKVSGGAVSLKKLNAPASKRSKGLV